MFDDKQIEIKPFPLRVWLSSPTMHGEELAYMKEAYETNWISTVGKNINDVEHIAAEKPRKHGTWLQLLLKRPLKSIRM